MDHRIKRLQNHQSRLGAIEDNFESERNWKSEKPRPETSSRLLLGQQTTHVFQNFAKFIVKPKAQSFSLIAGI